MLELLSNGESTRPPPVDGRLPPNVPMSLPFLYGTRVGVFVYFITHCTDIPVLIVTPPAIGELFVNVTAYELAYTRSPARMKGFVYSFTLFNQAISAAIALALAGVIRDPWLVWPWTAMAVITFCVAWVFPTYFKHLNVPMKDFANRDRQAGLHQPKYMEEEKTAAGGVHQ